MADLRLYRRLYAALLRLYPAGFRERFAASMEQTFIDLCREREAEGKPLFAYYLRLSCEALAGILTERTATMMPTLEHVIRLALVTALILAIPLVGMRFSNEVNWSLLDFVVMGVLVFGTGFVFLLVAGRMRRSSYRAAAGLGLATGFLIIWINLAVGIIGSEDNPANLLYLGVLLVAVVGSAAARLRPRPMARTMFATAITQAAVPFVAMLVFRPLTHYEDPGAGLVTVIFLNTALALFFAGSGVLFRQAGLNGNPPSTGQSPRIHSSNIST